MSDQKTEKMFDKAVKATKKRGARGASSKIYEVIAGRQIYLYGKPFISIGREGDTEPVEADKITHRIARLLNKEIDERVLRVSRVFRPERKS